MINHFLKATIKTRPVAHILIASIVLSALIPVSILGYKLYDMAWDNAWREITEKHQLLAENLSHPVSMYVKDRRQVLNILGNTILGLKHNELTPVIKSLIRNTLTSVEGFHSISWIDLQGNIIYNQFSESYHPFFDVNLKNNSAFITASSGVWSVTNVLTSPISGEPVLLLGIPVVDQNDVVKSVLIAELDTLTLEVLRKNIKFGIGGHSAFVDHNGRAIAHPNPDWAAEAKDLSHINVVQFMMSGKTGVTEFYSPFVKENMVVGYTSVPELGWGIMVPQPKSEVEKQVNDILYTQLKWGIIGIAIAILLGYFLNRWITYPINRLVNGTNELLTSEFKNDIPMLSIYAPKEIQKLANALSTLQEATNKSHDEINSFNASLQEKVESATQQIRSANKQLEIVAYEAEQASRAKSSFLANMSHELRTPMNAIIGYSEILEEDARDCDALMLIPDIHKILHAGKHLLTLISDILDLSKIEAGKMEMFLETFDLQDLIDDIHMTLEPLAEKNSNEFEIVIQDDLGEMHSDITKVKQILYNLLSNAFKFTHNGKVSLIVSRATYSEKDMYKFIVSDTGIGMTDEQMQTLFHEFSQADTSTTRKYGGTGLGLAISRFFSHMLLGDIDVSSKTGEGSKFTLMLPAHVAIDQNFSVPESKLPSLPQTTPEEQRFNSSNNTWKGEDRRKKISTVLIVDSDPHSREIIERILRKKGFHTHTVEKLTEGLAIAKEHQPNIISIDMNLPEEENWNMIDEIKKDASLENVPLLVLTMFDEEGKALENQGASAYLTKPITRNQIEQVIKHLARRSSRNKKNQI